MIDNEQLLGRGLKSISRVRVPITLLSLVGGLGLLAMACSAQGSGEPTVWNDPNLLNKPDRGLTSVQIRLDFQHDPSGSVRAVTCYDNTGRFRVVSREISPRPGPGPDPNYLVDKTFDHEAQCYPDVWTVSPIDVGDDEVFYLAMGNTDEDLLNARAYGIRRTDTRTLIVELLGSEPIGAPGTLKMRDAVVKSETPTPPFLEITEFSIQNIIAGEKVGINVITKGRPIGTTLRVSYFTSSVDQNITPEDLEKITKDEAKKKGIKELGVPEFNTNPDNQDWPIWNIKDLPPGFYVVTVEARPDEAKGKWDDPSVKTKIMLFEVNH